LHNDLTALDDMMFYWLTNSVTGLVAKIPPAEIMG